jgi:hypothetical protein
LGKNLTSQNYKFGFVDNFGAMWVASNFLVGACEQGP